MLHEKVKEDSSVGRNKMGDDLISHQQVTHLLVSFHCLLLSCFEAG